MLTFGTYPGVLLEEEFKAFNTFIVETLQLGAPWGRLEVLSHYRNEIQVFIDAVFHRRKTSLIKTEYIITGEFFIFLEFGKKIRS